MLSRWVLSYGGGTFDTAFSFSSFVCGFTDYHFLPIFGGKRRVGLDGVRYPECSGSVVLIWTLDIYNSHIYHLRVQLLSYHYSR